MPESTISNLKQILREVEDHHQSVPARFIEYYESPGESEFDLSPHDQQFQHAAHYIEFTLLELSIPERYREVEVADQFQYADIGERPVDWEKRRKWAKQRIEDILYGIAMELLISGVHLKIDTEGYLTELLANNRTPHVNESKKRLLENLEGSIDSDTVEEIDLVLQLAKAKRNNLVHFGFHYQGAHYFPVLFIDVSGFLIDRYADTDDIPELDTMASFRAAYDRRHSEAELYPEVGIDFKP